MTTIALAGNPNAGKSTLFNALTGSHQHVGNWHGKTVEKKAGHLHLDAGEVVVVDLPGTYSLNAYSVEEIIARDFIIHEHPEAVIAVVDSANLERNLYLVLQLLEMGTRLILVLNMSDIAASRGIQIDEQKLAQKLGDVPIIRTIGYKQTGLAEVRHAIQQFMLVKHGKPAPLKLPLPAVMETEIKILAEALPPTLAEHYHPRWLAIKLLEGDEDIVEKLAAYPDLIALADLGRARIETASGDDPDTLVAEARYDLIGQWVRDVVKRPAEQVLTPSDRLDKILTHRTWGLPIFFGLMWLVFQITANVSAPFLDWVDGVVTGPFTHWMSALLGVFNLETTWFGALVLEGVIGGVGGVLVFIPVLMSLYLTIAMLEDSGYMARAAFVMDRSMSKLGLQGKSFLPLLVGFGCTVPAVYATRTLENELDRKITGFLTTFMSCGARLPVYVLFGAVFFGGSGTFIFAMYVIGIMVAVLTSFLLTRLVYKDKPITPFVMELPPYRVPNGRVVWQTTWERTMSFVKNAGTLILTASVAIWLLMALPLQGGEFAEVEPEDSLFGAVSGVIAPVFQPAGFGSWEASGSLITGFVAKEVVIASMTQIYLGAEDESTEPTPTFAEDVRFIGSSFLDATLLTGQEILNIVPRTLNVIPGVNIGELGAGDEEDQSELQNALTQTFTPLSALAFNVFILLYVPCMSAVAAMKHEFGWRWTVLQALYTLVVAWLAAVLVYQMGSLIGV